MEWVLSGLVVGGFVFFTAIVLPWISRARIYSLSTELQAVRKQQQDLFSFLKSAGMALPAELTAAPKIWAWQQTPDSSQTLAQTVLEKPTATLSEGKSDAQAAGPFETMPRSIGFEQQFGAQLPVWIGGVALALAGFFLVKYSIETGLLSPVVRVITGLLFGCGLLCAADKVRAHPRFANGTRIAQALSGAGIPFYMFACLRRQRSMIWFRHSSDLQAWPL